MLLCHCWSRTRRTRQISLKMSSQEILPDESTTSDATLTDEQESMSARLRRTEQRLMYELDYGRTERCLLERLVCLKDEDLEYMQNRLQAAQGRAMRLTRELRECRCELIERRGQFSRVSVDNVRLRAGKYVQQHFQIGQNSKREAGLSCAALDSSRELRMLLDKSGLYQSSYEKSSWIQYADTAL